MPNLNQTIDRSLSISRGVATVLERRLREAWADYATRIRRAQAAYAASAAPAAATAPQQALRDWWEYNVDFVQRSILFWDTLRQRGNNWIAHEAAGKPPVLAYKYEMLCDGRTFERRVNHALVRIV
ncbi:MAG TPA: DUF3141 domain-containing protein, partial [Casimicrobiaceae bacterium]|nr:DUF3141 domain-containing protein [Casimicrobiaceae bacterium]